MGSVFIANIYDIKTPKGLSGGTPHLYQLLPPGIRVGTCVYEANTTAEGVGSWAHAPTMTVMFYFLHKKI